MLHSINSKSLKVHLNSFPQIRLFEYLKETTLTYDFTSKREYPLIIVGDVDHHLKNIVKNTTEDSLYSYSSGPSRQGF
jgi:NADPH-dependent 7-cyano-7-deazaguanine reductase QueF-like protein